MTFSRYACMAACALLLCTTQAAAQPDYQLEKVVELSRHGVRPPTPGNRKEIKAATQRPWPAWSTRDGEQTGHGYAALVNKGRWEGEHYRQLGRLPAAAGYLLRASPLQRTLASAEALMDGAFPGCGVTVRRVAGDKDPLF
ncbi:3-phytase|nr:3-phytase [Candidatus Pantoea persica]